MTERIPPPFATSKTTLLFLLKNDEILLAEKKRGFGEGKWNGTGGKGEKGETVEQTAVRETQEEIGVTPLAIERVATLFFYFASDVDKLGKAEETAVFFAREWEGEPHETEEMRPQWFPKNSLPFEQMWEDDQYWVPRVLEGEKLNGEFWFDEAFKLINHKIETLS